MRRPRAVVFIEFAMIFPLFLFLSLLAVDTGRWVLARAELQDATQQAARTGAQAGGARVQIDGCGGFGASECAFRSALQGYGFPTSEIPTPVVKSGSSCSGSDRYVTISASIEAPRPIAPGLASFLGIIHPGDGGAVKLSATSVALCEITSPG